MAAPKTTKKTVEAPTETEIGVDAELETEDLLADLPKLKAPERLRIRERNRLMAIVLAWESIGLKLDEELDEDKDHAKLLALYDVVADIDDFAQSIAASPETYAAWAEGKDANVFMALLHRYSVALGK